LFLSEIILSGNLCLLIIILLKAYNNFLVLLLSLYKTNSLYLVNLSIVIYILLYNIFVISFLEDKSLTMKSNIIDVYASYRTSTNCNRPYDTYLLVLFLLYKSYSIIIISICFLIPGK
jgi:hypothetical protein